MSKETPLLMCAEMVLAALENRKSQTRRIVKRNASGRVEITGKQWHIDDPNAVMACRYGQVSDRLWVKETWKPHCDCDAEGAVTEEHPLGTCVKYRADGAMVKPTAWTHEQGFWCEAHEQETKWRPSIFMPRWASRITLEITGVRIERVQDISAADAMAEGIKVDNSQLRETPNFRELWDSLQRAGLWLGSNPFVWVITFKKLPK